MITRSRSRSASKWAAALGVAAACFGACASAVGAPGSPVKRAAVQGHAIHDEHDHDHSHDSGTTPQALAERQRLLNEGESRLRAGDADGARQAFEQAALQAHAAHIEMGVLRAQMLAGEYRLALAFAAHTAGVHLDDVQGRVFYAWLLNLGGQEAMAELTLQQAEAKAPAHPMVQAARQRFRSGELFADGVLLSVPARLAPFATGAAVAGQARVAASALLLSDGRHALVPQAALPASGSIWLRNGLGQTVVAERTQEGAALGLTLLRLRDPLPVPAGDTLAPRDAFAGSPAFAIDYARDPAAGAAWPVMRAGFLGSPEPAAVAVSAASAGVRRLGVALPGQGWRGGPVLDQGGRLVGVALGGQGRADSLVTVGALRSHFGERFGAVAATPRAVPLSPDELYERAMKSCLQLIVSPP